MWDGAAEWLVFDDVEWDVPVECAGVDDVWLLVECEPVEWLLWDPDEELWLVEWLLLVEKWLPPFPPPRARAGTRRSRKGSRRTLRAYGRGGRGGSTERVGHAASSGTGPCQDRFVVAPRVLVLLFPDELAVLHQGRAELLDAEATRR